MEDHANQQNSSETSDAEYYLVETNLGNSYLIAQLPNVRVEFTVLDPVTGREIETCRHKIDMPREELRQFSALPPTHMLKFNPTTRKLDIVPKHPSPPHDKSA